MNTSVRLLTSELNASRALRGGDEWPQRDSNPHAFGAVDFESTASANSAMRPVFCFSDSRRNTRITHLFLCVASVAAGEFCIVIGQAGGRVDEDRKDTAGSGRHQWPTVGGPVAACLPPPRPRFEDQAGQHDDHNARRHPYHLPFDESHPERRSGQGERCEKCDPLLA